MRICAALCAWSLTWRFLLGLGPGYVSRRAILPGSRAALPSRFLRRFAYGKETSSFSLQAHVQAFGGQVGRQQGRRREARRPSPLGPVSGPVSCQRRPPRARGGFRLRPRRVPDRPSGPVFPHVGQCLPLDPY